VGSWASLQILGKEVFHWKSEVDPTFLFLFTREDVTYTPLVPEADDPYANPLLVLRSTVRVLADRLDALGIAATDLDSCLQHSIEEQLELIEQMADPPWGLERDEVAIAELQHMTFERWVERVRVALPNHNPFSRTPSRGDYTDLEPLMSLWEDFDPRWLLRAFLEACEPDEEVVLDLTDLALGGYLEEYDFDPQVAATVMFSAALLNGVPAVVITEGTNDAEFLRAAIEVRRPHLAQFVRFYDFGSVPGGASFALSTVKSLAAAGVSNRVIVLLDNDTAAREARRSMKHVQLPGHYAIDHYPPLELATSYPSVGPTGAHVGDVNGHACSIEMYAGRDALTDSATGELRPVVWSTHIRAVGAYQGEVADKAAIHDAFRAKVVSALEDPAVIDDQDWDGMDAILDKLMELLRSLGVPDPAQRNAFTR
jgi:5S rRNA maturation endonuclease (ribonuclease M5)